MPEINDSTVKMLYKAIYETGKFNKTLGMLLGESFPVCMDFEEVYVIKSLSRFMTSQAVPYCCNCASEEAQRVGNSVIECVSSLPYVLSFVDMSTCKKCGCDLKMGTEYRNKFEGVDIYHTRFIKDKVAFDATDKLQIYELYTLLKSMDSMLKSPTDQYVEKIKITLQLTLFLYNHLDKEKVNGLLES